MVAFSDLSRVQLLYSQARDIDDALKNLEGGGPITAMTIGGVPTDNPGVPMTAAIQVSTVGVPYPPQMIEGIKTAFGAKRAAIEKELSDLGVSGMEQAARLTTR